MWTGAIWAASAPAVEKIMQECYGKLPRGTSFDLRGQVRTMETSFYRLGLGMIFAVVLVYLLMAVNFQSWLDPFIILMALPGALAGIVWMLFITQTTLQRAVADGRHHVHRRGHRQQYSDGGVRQRPARWKAWMRAPRRSRPAIRASARC